MVSRCNPQYSWLSHWWLSYSFIMMWHFSVTESAAQNQFNGEVGGNVTIRCPVVKQKTIVFLYLQKGHAFVNGYHSSRNISDKWQNTRMDINTTSVDIYSLNVSHGGDYECIVMYNDSHRIEKTVVHLSVTANYSKPTVNMWCSDENHGFCVVTCSSHGGYPEAKMMWNPDGNEMCKIVNSSEMRDPNTMMFSSSSTASFNCSRGELELISCSVRDVTSHSFSVCTPKETYSPYSVIAAAICAVVICIIITVVLCWWRCKKGQMSRGAASEAGVKEEWIRGCEEEGISLTEGKEAA